MFRYDRRTSFGLPGTGRGEQDGQFRKEIPGRFAGRFAEVRVSMNRSHVSICGRELQRSGGKQKLGLVMLDQTLLQRRIEPAVDQRDRVAGFEQSKIIHDGRNIGFAEAESQALRGCEAALQLPYSGAETSVRPPLLFRPGRTQRGVSIR